MTPDDIAWVNKFESGVFPFTMTSWAIGLKVYRDAKYF